ncbi:MAG: hypothetical protein R3F29_05080 [Planctomycetota bacterium]
MNRRTVTMLAMTLLGALLRAQEPAPDQEPKLDAATAIGRWLEVEAGDQQDEALRRRTVEAVLGDDHGLELLASRLGDAKPGPARNGLRELAGHVVLGFVRHERDRGMVFVGQFDGLKLLQPFASEFLFGLLLDTPDWYPFTWRTQVVAPLRDLEARLPQTARLERLLALAADDREPTDLRMATAAMLWQWGKKDPAQRFVAELMEATSVGDGEDRVQATLQLADYYNLLRDYPKAAAAHRTAQALAKGAGVTLLPIAWYAAACVHSLLGEVDRGIEALTKCVDMLASPDLDKSHRLERKLFEKDPEIAALRADPRFAALVERAFGKDQDGGERSKDDR